MKLFVRGSKQQPLVYEGKRQCSAFLQFLAVHCKMTSGGDLLSAQFEAYAQRFDLVSRLQRACSRLEMEAMQQPNLLLNPVRWFSMFFSDPEIFGEDSPDDDSGVVAHGCGMCSDSAATDGCAVDCLAAQVHGGATAVLVAAQLPAIRWMSLADKSARSLRFPVGTEVLCNFGEEHSTWKRGWIRSQWARMPGIPDGKCAAYALQLQDGTFGFAPVDEDECLVLAPASLDYVLRMRAHGVDNKDTVLAIAAQPGAIWLDVRSDDEVRAASLSPTPFVHLPVGADHDTSSIERRHAQCLDKQYPVVCFCALGGRASVAATALRKLGYAQAVNAGGYSDVVTMARILHARSATGPSAASSSSSSSAIASSPGGNGGGFASPTTIKGDDGVADGSKGGAVLTWDRLKTRVLRGRYPQLAQLLVLIEHILTGKFPERPYEYLASALVYTTAVGASTMGHNMPCACRRKFDTGEMDVWKRLKHAEGMSQLEVKRAWPGVVDAVLRPALANSKGERDKEMKHMMSTLKEIIERGMPIDAAPFGPSLAHVVAGMGPTHIRLLSKLFFSDINMQKLNTSDFSLPIEVAAAMGHVEVVDRLWAMGCSLGRALHCALHESQLGVAERLIACGVPVDLRWQGVSPLEWAILSKNSAVAQMLVGDHRAVITRRLSLAVCRRCDLAPGSTAVHLCAKMGLERVVEAMMKVQPRAADITNDYGHTPMQVADPSLYKLFVRDHMLCWKVLQQTLLNPEWDRAVPGNLERLASHLSDAIEHGGDPAAYNSVGWTALMAVALAAELEAARMLLSRIRCVCNPLLPATERRHDADVLADEKYAEHVIYATSPSGLTALLWAHWRAWICEQMRTGDDVVARANGIVAEFAAHGATLREEDKAALQRLKDAYRHGDAEERSLLYGTLPPPLLPTIPTRF